ncbi:MAG: hypothetical protein HY674_13180 [Chloroflexi bacterium]|nr:hypothetical protein [Chloroflexota bacterium]
MYLHKIQADLRLVIVTHYKVGSTVFNTYFAACSHDAAASRSPPGFVAYGSSSANTSSIGLEGVESPNRLQRHKILEQK